MTNGYQALTEKEKVTLRLLVSGYDAKSMARYLGLSIHTINERLRDARRKLAVSSSREAARLVREVEYADPELLGDNRLGDDPAPVDLTHLQPADEVPGVTRHFGWITGALVMSIGLALLAFSALSGTGTAPVATHQSSTSTETIRVLSAKQWLALVDGGDWNASWAATGQQFKALNTSAVWAEVSGKVRTPLGTVLSRELIGEENLPAPPAGYQVVKFRTSFANKAGATETISLTREDGTWKPVGYIIG